MSLDLAQNIQYWHDLSVEAEERGVYNQQVVGHGGADFVRAETYRRVVVALIMQAEDGQWRCSCHFKTRAELDQEQRRRA